MLTLIPGGGFPVVLLLLVAGLLCVEWALSQMDRTEGRK